MNRSHRCLSLVALVFAASLFCLSPTVVSAADASGAAKLEREEVAERIELNNATLEQIVGFGVVNADEAKKILQLRDDMGSLQSYEELIDLGIPADKVDKLKPFTTIQGIASDCTC